MAKHMPHISQLANLVVEDTTPEVLNGHDVIILALPHGASGKLASQLDPNAVVVDLGADHRLEEQAAWDEFYGGDFYEHWTYGMPELITGKTADGAYTVNVSAAWCQANCGPGCNVTATTLALQPGIAEGWSSRRTSWLIWSSATPAQARTSNAPTCCRRGIAIRTAVLGGRHAPSHS